MQTQISYVGASALSAPVAHGTRGQIDALGTVVVFRANQEIFNIGDQANYWYKVLSGSVRTVKLIADGRRQILEFLLPGEFFGFDGLSRQYASAEAIARTTLVRYPRRRIEMLAESEPSFSRMVREMVSEKLEAAHRRVLLLGKKSAEERIASFLLEIAERQCEFGSEVDLPMSRNDIADHIGLTLETVSRILNRLKRDGTIDLPSATHIRLCNRDRLEELYGEAHN